MELLLLPLLSDEDELLESVLESDFDSDLVSEDLESPLLDSDDDPLSGLDAP